MTYIKIYLPLILISKTHCTDLENIEKTKLLQLWKPLYVHDLYHAFNHLTKHPNTMYHKQRICEKEIRFHNRTNEIDKKLIITRKNCLKNHSRFINFLETLILKLLST
ncbi:hypothetical protein EDEG_01108 [Edhazardia aedis USNM 41457]|uniref:Uncharacterized protein n=1 Tax=Edhazardia aedis (strain USNM 41457) TaxID=1003232 RepID=J9DQ68_EDHAE|nr:hypothetical protein EDEG_01108 [Edhazardia aedis USNM 41457]|eukprot:EJW04695.1 hypothetical protein EDEG_01108 [Edhazardia aedis USNM 41457]